MRPAAKRQPVVRAARPGAGGVVSRPELWERLAEAARVTVVSAPPGSGKTVLLRSWIGAAGLAERAAWVPVGRDELDPQRLWLAVLDALRQTAPGAALVRPLTAAPDLDGWSIVERLLTDHVPVAGLFSIWPDRLGNTPMAGCPPAVSAVDGHGMILTGRRVDAEDATYRVARAGLGR